MNGAILDFGRPEKPPYKPFAEKVHCGLNVLRNSHVSMAKIPAIRWRQRKPSLKQASHLIPRHISSLDLVAGLALLDSAVFVTPALSSELPFAAASLNDRFFSKTLIVEYRRRITCDAVLGVP